MRHLVLLIVFSVCWLAKASTPQTDTSARVLLKQALTAQGGEAKLRTLQNVQWEAYGYRHLIEQSERPEGPYVDEFQHVSEIDDFRGNRFRTFIEGSIYPVDKESSATLIDGDAAMQSFAGHDIPGTAELVRVKREAIALSPQRLLLTALDAPDAHMERDVELQSITQRVIAFTLDEAPVRVYLNPFTCLPTAVDYSGPLAHTGFWAYMGDAVQRTYYSYWWLAKDGIHLPMQWNVETNGLPDHMLVMSKLQLNGPLQNANLTISPEMKIKFEANAQANTGPAALSLSSKRNTVVDLAPGIVLLSGVWNVALIDQGDGIVVLESPISSAYSAQVITEAHRRFPGKPIKGIVTTSDSWPHIAGIRQYAAEGIPIYALDLNRPIIQRFLNASYVSKPDLLARSPRPPQFHLIHEKTLLGAGQNRIEIYPIRGETSERQMMVFFPALHLLYGSDPFQQMPDASYHVPQTVTELTDAVERERLNVNKFWMMHVALTPWNELAKAVASAELTDSPSGILQ